MKQKLEGIFSNSFRTVFPNIYFLRLYSNPLSHQTTPADFLAIGENRYLIECKQVTLKDGKGAFAFDRVKQSHDMASFEMHHPKNLSYVLIMFYSGRVQTSEYYLLPLARYISFEKSWHKKSISNSEAKQQWFSYEIKCGKGNILDISNIHFS